MTLNRVNLRSQRRAKNPVDDDENRGNRYYDRAKGLHVTRINQGNCYVTKRDDEMLTTVLGSCIAACIRDPKNNVGGMNHFMLPASESGEWKGVARSQVSTALRYGNFAMEKLINDIMKKGGERRNLEVKVFGGGNVIPGQNKVGDNNATFVEDFLKAEGFKIAAKDLRGENPRKIEYLATTGRARMLKLTGIHNKAMAEREEERLTKTRVIEDEGGTIELWD